MARRELPEINAGSMADIAFLLLIFFLVTTTIDTEEGITTILPQKYTDYEPEPVKLNKRNLFSVTANFRDELLVEDDIIDISELKERTKEFYGDPFSGADRPGFPVRELVTAPICQQEIAKYQELVDKNADDKLSKIKLNQWKDKLMAVNMIGNFYEMPSNTVIFFKSDNGTTYGFYIQVTNELKAAVNELQNDYALRKFGVPTESLDPDNPEDDDKITVLKILYPNKLAEVTK